MWSAPRRCSRGRPTGTSDLRLGALGTLVWDRIWRPPAGGARPEAEEQWGGIAYSLAALSAARPPGWVVVPLVKIGADLEARARRFLAGMPGLELGPGARTVPEPNNRVELRYRDAANRTELLTGGVPRWSWDELEPLLGGLDALYLNFISGYELDLPTAQRLRAAFPGPIYTDLHSLFLGPPSPTHPRTPRPLPRWREWLACFDAVQVNEDELRLLGVSPEEMLEHGPRAAVVTRGGAGASFAARSPFVVGAEGAGSVSTGDVPPLSGEVAGDPTGCGDVWGSVLCAGLLSGLPLPEAIRRAHAAAARKLRAPGTFSLRAELADELRG